MRNLTGIPAAILRYSTVHAIAILKSIIEDFVAGRFPVIGAQARILRRSFGSSGRRLPPLILILVLFFPFAAMSGQQTVEEIAARAYRSAQAGDMAAAEADFRRVVDLAPRNPVCVASIRTSAKPAASIHARPVNEETLLSRGVNATM